VTLPLSGGRNIIYTKRSAKENLGGRASKKKEDGPFAAVQRKRSLQKQDCQEGRMFWHFTAEES